MAKARAKYSVLGLVIQYEYGGKTKGLSHFKNKVQDRTEVSVAVWLTGDETRCITSDICHQWCRITPLGAPTDYIQAILCMLHDDYGHQGLDWTLPLVRERFYWGTMNQDVTKYVTNCHWCNVTKDHYICPQTQLWSLVANNPLDLLCIDFLKVDPSKGGKENILVLTDAFTKFSHAFVTNN